MKKNSFFVASTGQNVGKTTTCLGLISGLKKRFNKVGFIKPIGQEHLEVQEGLKVDKDVVLFKDTFGIKDAYSDMSPVLFPRGFTRDYLDGKISHENLAQRIEKSYQTLSKSNQYLVVEGTGHVGVGSIANLNNAKAAALLKTPIIIIASGGLGSSFDALSLNKVLCDKYNVPVAGVILNRVLPEKKEMIQNYMELALKRWNIPILGSIPYNSFLSRPSMNDYASLLKTDFLSGSKHKLRHFEKLRLVATSLKAYQNLIFPSQLVITPASREDIILATLTKHWDLKIQDRSFDLASGMILTGSTPPSPNIIKQLEKAEIPMLYAPLNTFDVMKKMTSYIAKIRTDDKEKVQAAISLVEAHIDFDQLIECVGNCTFS